MKYIVNNKVEYGLFFLLMVITYSLFYFQLVPIVLLIKGIMFLNEEFGFYSDYVMTNIFATFIIFLFYSIVIYAIYRLFLYGDKLFVANINLRYTTALFVSIFLLYLISALFFQYENFTLQVSKEFYESDLKHHILFVMAFMIVVPVVEEVCFRGVIMGFFLKESLIKNEKIKIAIALILPSVMFTLLHTQYEYIWTYIQLFIFSLIVSVARLLSNGILLPIALHSFAIACATGFSLLLI